MPKVTFDNIQYFTDEFFRRHWSDTEAGIPVWNKPWDLKGTLHGHHTQGIYLLLGQYDEVLYIGVAASLGYGKYLGHGMGSRTKKYICMAEGQRSVSSEERKYIPQGKWIDLGLSKIITLSFNQDYAYLAYGLEAFLLRELKTPQNKIRSARASNF